MINKRLHTPEGVRDIYSFECEKKLILESRLNDKIRQFGYHPIQTPTFEFFDIFVRDVDTTSSRELYKFFDREGNTLVLRPDITPSVARSAAKYFSEEDMPIRLFYMGNTFVNNTSYQGRPKESTQLGAELIGDDSTDADAEIISMAIECLKAAGLSEFKLSIGHAGFFKALMDEAGLIEEQEDELRELIMNRNFFGVSEFVSKLNLAPDLEKLFSLLKNLYESQDEIAADRSLAAGYPRIAQALKRLEELNSILELYGISEYVTYDLSMLANYRYYTGIIFAGYTYGSGDAIVRGGRYDSLISYFGKNSPSVGFAFVVDQLMAAISRQGIEIPVDNKATLLVYSPASREAAIKYANDFRTSGDKIELMMHKPGISEDDYKAYADRNLLSHVMFML